MVVEIWFDYVCPWCYLALDRVRHLVDTHGAEPVWRPYELHPETPPGGVPVRGAGGAGGALAEAGLVATRVDRLVNSHDALSLFAGLGDSPRREALHRSLFAAVFAQGRDISDRRVLTAVADDAGIEADLEAAIAAGEGALRASMEEAWEAGIAATPGWRFAGELVLTGAHPTQVLDRVIRRMSG